MRPQRGKATCHKRDGLRWASRPAPAPAARRGRGPLALTSRPPVRLYTRMPCNKTISSHRGSEIKLHVYFHPQLFFFLQAGEFSNSQQTDGVTRVDDKTERKGRAKSRRQHGGHRGGRGGRRRKKGRREPARRAHAAPRKRPRETHAVSAARAAPVDGTKNDRNR